MQTYLNLDHLPIGMAYFDVSQWWWGGMWSTFSPAVIATAYDGIIAVPMLIGPQPITHLTAGLTSGVAVTSLPVSAIPATGGITSGTLIPSGTVIAVLAGNTPNYFTASANVSVGATSIPVTSQAPTTTYASGAGVKAQMTVSPQAATDTTGAGNTPTIMTMAAIAAGTWNSHFTKCFQAAAD